MVFYFVSGGEKLSQNSNNETGSAQWLCAFDSLQQSVSVIINITRQKGFDLPSSSMFFTLSPAYFLIWLSHPSEMRKMKNEIKKTRKISHVEMTVMLP